MQMLIFVDQNMFEGIACGCIGIGKGLGLMPTICIHQRWFDHAEKSSQQIAGIGRMQRFSHQPFQRIIVRWAKGGSLDLAQPLIEMLYMLGILPQQTPHVELPFHLGGGWQPTCQDADDLILDKAIAVQQTFVGFKFNHRGLSKVTTPAR